MGAVRDRSILIACIGAGSAIVAAFAKPICDTLIAGGPQPTTPAAVVTDDAPITPTPGPTRIEGAWKQYVLTPDEGAVYLGTFVVSQQGGEYLISPRTQPEGERFQNSLGVFDVAYDGQTWSYNSNWGGGEIGNYELQRISPTVFEGEIRVAGQLSNRTRVVKIR